ncbi:unnamed protein product [Dibothriocephalus latus]|uniref:Uncharacterized protein n=1 Tax=Dibothriocephalus latus TaxID=60516 RepID=A0A3P6PWS0_DIBLA|nr:unnamed protein product [Dibothriocephalus latus]
MKVTAEKPFENRGASSAPRQRFSFIEQSEFDEASSETEDDDSASDEDGDEFEELQLSRDSLQASKFRHDGDSGNFIPKLQASDSTSNSFDKLPTFTRDRYDFWTLESGV